jgi:hypothetical protein
MIQGLSRDKNPSIRHIQCSRVAQTQGRYFPFGGRLVDKLVANLVDNSGQKPVKMLH